MEEIRQYISQEIEQELNIEYKAIDVSHIPYSLLLAINDNKDFGRNLIESKCNPITNDDELHFEGKVELYDRTLGD